MKWWWNKETKAVQGGTRSVYIDDMLGDFVGCAMVGERITPQKAFKFYRENSSVATAVDMIADAFERINPILQKPDGSVIEAHDVLELLKNPNVYMTWSDLAARLARHYLLTNETHMYGVGTTGLAPIEIYPVKPIGVSVTTGASEYVQTYHIGNGVATGTYSEMLDKQRIMRYYDGPLRELYRVAGFSSSPTDGGADSPLQAAALETNQQIKGRVHNTKVLDNGGRLSLLIVFKEERLSDDEHKERTRRINETFGGPKNAGKIGVMSGGDIEEVKEMGVNNKDMDYAELDRIAGQAIYFRYKIPLPLISTTASTFNNMQTGIEMLYDFAILPLADKIFSGLTRFLLPRYGIDINTARITYDPDSLQSLKARRLDELKKRKDIGIETVNEMRKSIPNREDVEGGEVIYQPATMIPLGVDMLEPEPRTGGDDET